MRDAEVVGHSLGGPVAIALAEQSPQLVDRLVAIDSIPDTSYGDVGFIGELPFKPVIGEALWRIKPDFSIRDGLEVAFAPGFPVPDAFVEDVKRMTYSAYTGSHDAFDDYTGEEPLPERAAAIGKPLLAIMGAEEQIANDPSEALAAYREAYPGAETKLIAGAGHSPNVEKPAADRGPRSSASPPHRQSPERPASRHEMQEPLQNPRRRPQGAVDSNLCSIRRQTLQRGSADAVDLLIDFATLGEYGLEPAGRPASRLRVPPAAASGSSGRSAHGRPQLRDPPLSRGEPAWWRRHIRAIAAAAGRAARRSGVAVARSAGTSPRSCSCPTLAVVRTSR